MISISEKLNSFTLRAGCIPTGSFLFYESLVRFFHARQGNALNDTVYYLKYHYDANGNRIRKTVQVYLSDTPGESPLNIWNGSNTKTTWYVCEGGGKVLAVYEREGESGEKKLKEATLFGSGQLGMAKPEIPQSIIPIINAPVSTRTLDKKVYQLSDHLGNVRATIGDSKQPTAGGYIADVKNTTNYYPFGMEQKGRSSIFENHRYGYNGKEKDDEISGEGAQYDYGFRTYDSRVSRFLSTDPLSSSYPWYTPYQFAGNKPVWATDIDGLEEYIYQYRYSNGSVQLLKKINNLDVPESKYHSSLIINRTTGKPATEADFGTVQYQYVDENGNDLHIHRDVKGNFRSGDGGNIPIYDDNLFGSIYIGKDNPQVNGTDDYRREPQDIMDAAARIHDLEYDRLTPPAKGVDGAVVRTDTRPADTRLLATAIWTWNAYNLGMIDPITQEPVTKATALRAKGVAAFFGINVEQKLTREATKWIVTAYNNAGRAIANFLKDTYHFVKEQFDAIKDFLDAIE